MAVPKYDLLAASTLTLQPSHISCPITQLALLNKVRMKRVNYLLQHYTSSESSTMNSALSTCGAGSILVRVEWTPLESQKLSGAHYHNFHYQMCRSWSYSKSKSELWERAKGHIQWALRESKGSYVVSSKGAGGQTSEPVRFKSYKTYIFIFFSILP